MIGSVTSTAGTCTIHDKSITTVQRPPRRRSPRACFWSWSVGRRRPPLRRQTRRSGLTTAPQIAVADGALGFWKALGEVWPTTREQRCWVHKTANILNKMPKSLHTKAKHALQEIWMAETKKDAVKALEAPVQARGRLFVETYQIKYE